LRINRKQREPDRSSNQSCARRLARGSSVSQPSGADSLRNSYQLFRLYETYVAQLFQQLHQFIEFSTGAPPGP